MVRATEITIERPWKKGQMVPYTQPMYLGRYVFRHRCPYSLNINPYVGCSAQCKYCFSMNQHEEKHDNFEWIRTLDYARWETEFVGAIKGRYNDRVSACIQRGVPIKLGAMCDGFQEAEETYKSSFLIMKLLNRLKYPLIINTKFPTMLCEPDYLNLLKTMPAIVQVSLTSSDVTASRLEAGAPSPSERINAIKRLSDNGIICQMRIAPSMPMFEDEVDAIIKRGYSAGAKDVLSNHIRLTKKALLRINAALGYDYMAKAKREGYKFLIQGAEIVPTACWDAARQRELKRMCDGYGIGYYPSPDHNAMLQDKEPWVACCGIEKYPGFSTNMSWTFQKRGYKIKRHTTFAEYIKGSGCPYIPDFQRKWNDGKFQSLIPGLVFHPSDKTYSRYKTDKCGYVMYDKEGELLPGSMQLLDYNKVSWP